MSDGAPRIESLEDVRAALAKLREIELEAARMHEWFTNEATGRSKWQWVRRMAYLGFAAHPVLVLWLTGEWVLDGALRWTAYLFLTACLVFITEYLLHMARRSAREWGMLLEGVRLHIWQAERLIEGKKSDEQA